MIWNPDALRLSSRCTSTDFLLSFFSSVSRAPIHHQFPFAVKLPKDQVLDVFRETKALLEGHFQLTSGLHSPQYFQCAKVLQYPKYLHLLCGEIAKHFDYADVELVISPAIGGVVVGRVHALA